LFNLIALRSNLVKCFVTRELMRWPGIEGIYGPSLRQTTVFATGGDGAGDKRWEELHTRVIEHVRILLTSSATHLKFISTLQNIRVISQYYTRITLPRLTSLLDLSAKEAEEILCRLVVSGTIYAKIDRPAKIVSFRSRRSAEDVMNEWSSDVEKLMGLVEKAWMGMNAALAGKIVR
jgi:26S proteasome regulatory subunit N5